MDVETGLTRGTGTLRNTLLASLPSEIGGLPTYVLPYNGQTAIGQLRHQPNDPHARIAFVAPLPQHQDDLPLWESLMEALTVVAGERGANSVIAEVNEDSLAFEGLRKVGFSIYARQEIWRREPAPLAEGGTLNVQPCRSVDEFGATLLYSNVVPGILQQAEPVPPLTGAAYIVREDELITGLVSSHRGPQSVLLQAHLHPETEQRADEVINGTLHQVRAERQTVYFRVRRYQEWLGMHLSTFGFESIGAQAVMVKQIVVRVGREAFKPLPAIKSGARISRPTPTTVGEAHTVTANNIQGISAF